MIKDAVTRVVSRRAAVLSFALGLVALGLCDASGADADRARIGTSSSFGFYAGNDVVLDAFLGQVSSREPACLKGRKAVVFRKRRGRDARLGADRTSSTGQWIVEKRRVRRGRYYLKVAAVELRGGGHRTCGRYRSSTIPVRG